MKWNEMKCHFIAFWIIRVCVWVRVFIRRTFQQKQKQNQNSEYPHTAYMFWLTRYPRYSHTIRFFYLFKSTAKMLIYTLGLFDANELKTYDLCCSWNLCRLQLLCCREISEKYQTECSSVCGKYVCVSACVSIRMYVCGCC